MHTISTTHSNLYADIWNTSDTKYTIHDVFQYQLLSKIKLSFVRALYHLFYQQKNLFFQIFSRRHCQCHTSRDFILCNMLTFIKTNRMSNHFYFHYISPFFLSSGILSNRKWITDIFDFKLNYSSLSLYDSSVHILCKYRCVLRIKYYFQSFNRILLV